MLVARRDHRRAAGTASGAARNALASDASSLSNSAPGKLPTTVLAAAGTKLAAATSLLSPLQLPLQLQLPLSLLLLLLLFLLACSCPHLLLPSVVRMSARLPCLHWHLHWH